MNNRKIYFIKALIIYLLILSILLCSILLIRIEEILNNFNLFFLSLLLLNIFIVAINCIFLFRRNLPNDYKLVLLYNSIFSLVSGISFRMFGYAVSNNLGVDFSTFFTKNNVGVAYGFHYDTFNLIVKLFRYDEVKLTGFSVQINLIMWWISICLFYFYYRLRISPTPHSGVRMQRTGLKR
jgi:hypothetical protein